MELEANQDQGLWDWDNGKRVETEEDRDVLVVKTLFFCPSPGTRAELNYMCNSYLGAEFNPYAPCCSSSPPWNLNFTQPQHGDHQNHCSPKMTKDVDMRYNQKGDNGIREETEEDRDVLVVKNFLTCPSPGTLAELNYMCNSYLGAEFDPYAPCCSSSPPWDLNFDQNHSSPKMTKDVDMRYNQKGDLQISLSTRWRILMSIIDWLKKMRYKFPKNVVRKEFGEDFADQVHLCHAKKTFGDSHVDKGKHVISGNNHHPFYAPKNGWTKAIASGNEDGMAPFETVEANCHLSKVENLIGDNDHLDQESRETDNTENEVVIAPFAGEASPKTDSHTDPDRRNPVHDLENQSMEICQNVNGLASIAGELSAEASCDVENLLVVNNYHALENGQMVTLENKVDITTFVVEVTEDAGSSSDGRNNTGDKKGLPDLENGQMIMTSQSEHVKVKTLTLLDIQTSLTQGMNLQDAAQEHGVSRSTFKRRCRRHGIERWPGRKRGKSHCAKQQKCNNEHFEEILDASSQQSLSGSTLFDCHELPPRKKIRTTRKETRRTTQNQTSQDHEALAGCSSGARQDRSSSIFDVKATYEKTARKIRFRFKSTSSISQMREDVGRRLKLEISKFEIQYLDDKADWVDMVLPEDLQLCLCLSSPGTNHIELRILDL